MSFVKPILETINKKPILFGIIFLFLINAGLYSNSLKHPFMVDDGILTQPYMKDLKFLPYHLVPDPKKFYKTGEGQIDVYYRPIAHSMFLLINVACQGNILGYHLISLFLFWIANCLLFVFLFNVFDDKRLSILTSLLFCIHPINGFLVNYITACYFSVQTIFIILTLWIVYKSISSKNQILLSILSCVCFLIALLCHETSMLTPFFALSLLAFSQPPKNRNLKKAIPLFIILVIYFLFRMKYSSLNESVIKHYFEFNMSFFEYFASLSKITYWYIAKLFYPWGIVLTWGIPTLKSHLIEWSLALILGIAVTFTLIWKYKQKPAIAIGLSWFFLGLAILGAASLVQPPRGFLIEPFWLIFASIGFFLAVSQMTLELYDNKKYKKWAAISTTILIALLSFTAYRTNKLWDNEKEYCLYWKKVAPEFSAVNCHLARVYGAELNFERAKYYHLGCLTEAPGDKFNYYSRIGYMEIQEGNWDKAKEYFIKANEIYPKESGALTNLGAIAYRDKNYPLAKQYFNDARAYDKFTILPRLNLATMSRKDGDINQAIELYKEIIDIDPYNEKAWIELLKIYWSQSNKQKSIEIAKKLKVISQNPVTFNNLGIIFGYYKMNEDEILCYNMAIKLDPRWSDSYYNLGKAYVRQNNKTEGQKILKIGLELFPNEQRFNDLLNNILNSTNQGDNIHVIKKQ